MFHPSIRRFPWRFSRLLPWPWPWPVPALFAWLLAWVVFAAAAAAGVPPALAFLFALGAGGAVAMAASGLWRRALAAAGFPLSALALGALPALPAWGWLLAALPLLLAYPLRAWRDAPFFPTPADALVGLDQAVVLASAGEGARVLDAGCGLGHGLQALRRVWPQARLEGLEWSRPLAWGAAWRCRSARVASVTRGDMWAASWAGFDVVYLFQRPESMARAMAKAERELAPGRWLVSLEFPVPGRTPLARCGAAGGRPVWVYRIGDAQPSIARATRR
jgi:SAM-dependent methyltransferase